MDEAFLSLLEKKDFVYITVKEICEKAGVNRSTFYLHYETAGDLLAESTQHLINRFVSYMPYSTEEFLKKINECPLEELYLITPEYLTPYLIYIKENRRVFKAAVEQPSVLQMDEAYRDLNRYVFEPILNRFGVPSEDRAYIMRFYISGLMAIISGWLENDCGDSVEYIASVMQKCIRSPQTERKEKI